MLPSGLGDLAVASVVCGDGVDCFVLLRVGLIILLVLLMASSRAGSLLHFGMRSPVGVSLLAIAI
ncbi:hypothetical protein EMIT0232MI5_100110 [Pseudomonas sp. IT-232MI5]